MNAISMRAIPATFFCLSLTTAAAAHHPGGAGNASGAGPINTISASTLEQGRTVVGATFEYIELGGINDGDLKRAAEHAHEHGHDEHAHSIDAIMSPSLGLAYGLTNDLMLSLKLPYVLRQDIREGHKHDAADPAEVELRGDATGIGDISALAQWRFLNSRASGTEAALLLGAKAPTGRSHVEDIEGEEFETEFLPGSGAWDGMFGLAITQRAGQWSFDANGLYTAVGKGQQQTDLGDRVHYNVAVSYRWLGEAPHKHSHDEPAHNDGAAVDLVLELNGEWHDNQEIHGHEDPNSGGHTLYLAPGIRISEGAWSGFVSAGIPVVDKVNGVQSDPDFRIVTGTSVGF